MNQITQRKNSTQSLSCSKHTVSTAASSTAADIFIYNDLETDGSSVCQNSDDNIDGEVQVNVSLNEEEDVDDELFADNADDEPNRKYDEERPVVCFDGPHMKLIPDSIQLDRPTNHLFREHEYQFSKQEPHHHIHHQQTYQQQQQRENYTRTSILLDTSDFNHPQYLELPSSTSTSNKLNEMNEFLLHHSTLYEKAKDQLTNDGVHYLSESTSQTLFAQIEDVVESEDSDHYHYRTKKSQEQTIEKPPIIYVHQREIAHVSNEQYICCKRPRSCTSKNKSGGAILVSDNATTCHVIALRSYRKSSSTTTPSTKERNILGSLCHLDSTSYQSCLQKMIETHLEYHNAQNLQLLNRNSTTKLTMEVHIVGGYNDSNNTSIELTDHVLQFFDQISSQYSTKLECQLQTCIISSLNDITSYDDNASFIGNQEKQLSLSSIQQEEQYRRKMSISTSTSSLSSYNSCTLLDPTSTSGSSSYDSSCTSIGNKYINARKQPSPIIRGLAMDVSTGIVQLIRKVDSLLWGPEPTLRRARLWCPPDNENDDEEEGEDNTTDHNINIQPSNPSSTKHNLKSLLQIHTYTKEQIHISPFEFKPFEFIDVFYKLPDHVMLSMGSTSPDVEDGDFCPLVRETCFFLMNTKYESVFPLRRIKSKDEATATTTRSSTMDCTTNSIQRVGLNYRFDGEDWWQSMQT